jgi:hypothetical protein
MPASFVGGNRADDGRVGSSNGVEFGFVRFAIRAAFLRQAGNWSAVRQDLPPRSGLLIAVDRLPMPNG